ncbi:MAG TPA: hypothetical protein VFV87_18925 [Pirellulaceae bacterium]|nr:hypothetical protein [Pirellulaceae bacterium]
MRRILMTAMIGCLALAWAAPARACGSYLRMQVLQALADGANAATIEELRAAGPAALDELFQLRDQMTKSLGEKTSQPTPTADEVIQIERLQQRIQRLDEMIDQVGMQRYCSRSRLYWYTDFDKAVTAARESGKPILSLRMLGNLNEDFSCANSRFFRTTLYANAEISKTLRENFVLHWKSVRPVPRVTIDFGDGRKLERTVTGNSAHYILTPDGEVVDCLPGLYGPKAFLRKINEGLSMARQVAALSPSERGERLAAFHAKELADLQSAFGRDLILVSAANDRALTAAPQPSQQTRAAPPANVPTSLARPKARIETRLVAAAIPTAADSLSLDDDAVWQRIAALHAEDAQLDSASRELIKSENPTAAVAGRLAMTKALVENPLVRLVRSLQESIGLDTVKNEYRFHRQIHGWLADGNYRPGIDELNERVYAELFLTPSSDPWLGLAPPDAYTALPNGGVVANRGP